MSNRRFRPLAWFAALVPVLLFLVWAAPAVWQRGVAAQAVPREVASRGALPPAEQAVIDLFERARHSVVHITTQSRVLDLWTRNVFNVPRGTGSGFVWDERGHVVTNRHVVAEASGAQVRLSDGRAMAASLVGVSAAHDLAVLRIDIPDLPSALPLGTSADLRVGQTALAIGNPFGLDWMLTTGIVSALDRTIPSEEGRDLIQHVIQTDAAINPGNSGGPLLDSAGRLIGVTTMIVSASETSADRDGAVRPSRPRHRGGRANQRAADPAGRGEGCCRAQGRAGLGRRRRRPPRRPYGGRRAYRSR